MSRSTGAQTRWEYGQVPRLDDGTFFQEAHAATGTPPEPPPVQLPDLVVDDITWSPPSPTAGQAVTFTGTVRNQGGAATPEGIIIGVSFRIDGHLVTWSDTSTTALGIGASRDLTASSGPSGSATWPATEGSHSVRAWVNDLNRFSEITLANNDRIETIVVGAVAGGVQAKSAQSFTSIVGVSGHPERSSYNNYTSTLTARMVTMKIKNFRGGGWNPSAEAAFWSAFGNAGIKLGGGMVISSTDTGGAAARGPAVWANSNNGAWLLCMEGANEPDLAGWSSQALTLQIAGYNWWKTNHPSIPILGWSPGDQQNFQTVYDQNLGNYADYANQHLYWYRDGPERGGYTFGTNPLWGGTNGISSWLASMRTAYRKDCPIYITETGWNSKTTSGTAYVDPIATAKYCLRYFGTVFLDNPLNKCFRYELLETGDGWGGMVTAAPTFALTTNGYAVRNLLTILDDTPFASPGTLDYTITSFPSTGRQILLQKNSGSFYLILWNAVDSDNSGVNFNATRVSITLNLPAPYAINVYEPTPVGQYASPDDGLNPVSSPGTLSTVPLTLPDHLMIVKIG